MISKFINREQELEILEKEWGRNNSFVIVYGRRRIGKTELIKNFITKKPHISYIFPEASKQTQLNEFKQVVAFALKDDLLTRIEINDWYLMFDYLSRIIPENYCIALDEFTFGIKSDRKILSDLQRIWDQKFKDKKIMLLLSGSLLGMVYEDMLSQSSPLYGRRTRDILLEEVNFYNSKEFIKIPAEEFVKFYLTLGGIPEYLLVASYYKRFDDFLKEEFLNKRGYFYREIYFILSQEFREIKTYFSILQAIAFGNTRPNEIANFIGKGTRGIYPYMENLIRRGMVRKEESITGKSNGLYLLKEGFIDFWFNFVYKHREQIEQNNDFLVGESELNTYFGKRFEQLAREFLVINKPYEFKRIGRFWYKDAEIDIVTLNEETKEIVFFEVKWKEIGVKEAGNILDKLNDKSKEVKWNNEERKERYGVIAKKIKDKEDLRNKGFLAYDLDDFKIPG